MAINPKFAKAFSLENLNPFKNITSLNQSPISSASSLSSTSTNNVIHTITKERNLSTGLCAIIVWLWDKLKLLFRFLFLTRSPAAYVVWLLIIIALILGVGLGLGFGRKKQTLTPNKNVEDKKSKKKQKPKSSVLTDEAENDNDDYRKNAARQSVSGQPNKVDGYKRNLVSGGRCDGIEWIDNVRNKKECVQILPPPSIRWELDSEQYSELENIPDKLLDEEKLIINIPYTFIQDRYYADCANMTYSDAANTPAKLFNQKNIKNNTCLFITKKATVYSNKLRNADSKDLYTLCQ